MGTAISYPYGYWLSEADYIDDDARGLFPEIGDKEEVVKLDVADVANIDNMLHSLA